MGGMPEYFTIVVNDIAWTPTRALGIYESREIAERGIEPWMRELGADVVPLITGFRVVGPETPYWPPVGNGPRLSDPEQQ